MPYNNYLKRILGIISKLVTKYFPWLTLHGKVLTHQLPNQLTNM